MTVLLPRDKRRSRYAFDLLPRWLMERYAGMATAPTTITNQAATFTRASVASSTDGPNTAPLAGAGTRLLNYAYGQPRPVWLDLDGDGIDETIAILLEPATTNLVPQSSNFGSSWTANNSPTRTAAAHSLSGVTLDLIGDNSGGAVAYYSQTVGFTGNGVKAVSICMRAGISLSSVVRLFDSTASADRLNAKIAWSGFFPTVTTTAGTYLGAVVMNDNVYRFYFATTSVTAANTNQVYVAPATTSAFTVADTGNVYAGGVQAEDLAAPSSLITTTGSTASRVAESLSFAFNAPPQTMTFYLKFVERGSLALASHIFQIGASSDTGARVTFLGSGGTYRMFLDNGSVNATADSGAGANWGQMVELLGWINSDGSMQMSTYVNGSIVSSSPSTAVGTIATAFGATTLWLNSIGSSNIGILPIIQARVAPGLTSIAYMREG